VNNLIKRVKSVAFGMTNWTNYRTRSPLYAGKPNWDLLTTESDSVSWTPDYSRDHVGKRPSWVVQRSIGLPPVWLTVATMYVTGLVDLAELISSGPIPLAGDSG
jgi:hypothetical protein